MISIYLPVLHTVNLSVRIDAASCTV